MLLKGALATRLATLHLLARHAFFLMDSSAEARLTNLISSHGVI